MTQNLPLAHESIADESFFDAIQEMLSGLDVLMEFELVPGDATTVRLPAGAGHRQVSTSIGGEYRWVTAPLTRTHPGGAAGTYDLCVTSLNNEAGKGVPPGANSGFALAITAENVAPAGVERYKVVRKLQWSGSAITRIDRLDVEGPKRHGSSHAVAGTDPLPANSAGQVQLVDLGVTTGKLADLGVTNGKIASGAVDAAKLANALKPSAGALAATEALRALGTTGSTAAAGNDSRFGQVNDDVVTEEKLTDALASRLGISKVGLVKRGKSVIAAEEFLADNDSPVFRVMPTPDRVSNILLEADGVLRILFRALWRLTNQAGTDEAGKNSPNPASCSAQVFINGVTLKGSGAPFGLGGADAAAMSTDQTGATARRFYRPIHSQPAGLVTSGVHAGVDSTFDAGGTVIAVTGAAAGVNGLRMGGEIAVEAAAGTYEIDVRYSVSSDIPLSTPDRVWVKQRKLWVKAEAY